MKRNKFMGCFFMFHKDDPSGIKQKGTVINQDYRSSL